MSEAKKYNLKLLMLAVINVLFLSVGHAFNVRIALLAALVMFLGITVLSKKRNFLPIMLFYLPWSPVLKISPGTFTFFTFVVPGVFLLIILGELIKGSKYRSANIFLPLFFTAYTLFVQLVNGYFFDFRYMFFIMMILFIPIYVNKYKEEINFETCVVFLTTGVLSACLAAKILMSFPHMLEYINVYEWKRVGLIRLSGFYGDANFYSLHILAAIACLLIMLSKTKETKLITLQFTSILALLYFGMLSVSKMFIICIILMAVLWFFCLLIEKRSIVYKFRIILTILLISAIAAASNLFSEGLKLYLIRFGMVTDTSSLTTGRSELMSMYFNFLLSSLKGLFIGEGISPNYLNGASSHNTIIQFIYRIGLIGSILILVWWGMIYTTLSNKIKLGTTEKYYIAILLVAFFLPWMSLEMLYFDEFFYITILAILARNYLSLKSKEEILPAKGATHS